MIIIIKTYIFLRFRILADISVLLILAPSGNIVIQLKFYLLCMLSGPEKKSGELFFIFHFFQQNSGWPTNHMLL